MVKPLLLRFLPAHRLYIVEISYIIDLINNQAEIEDRFYRDLEFGTGGLRGVIGAGTNRMNLYTVRKATQGLANFIINQLHY